MVNVKQRITELMQRHGWSEYRLAKESGLSISTISNMFNRNTLPSISTLQVICDSFGISLAQFFSEGTEVELSKISAGIVFKMALPYGRAKRAYTSAY